MELYNTDFFEMNEPESMAAAQAMLPWVLDRTGARTVIDIGCAQGAWLAVAESHGHGCLIHGVDGFADPEKLLFPADCFEQADLTNGYDCTGYDLAICMEVGEHLPESSAEALVAGLSKARFVLFSAAIPGQGGVGHINERWQTWWADLFAQQGLHGSTSVRDRFWTDDSIEGYYRQNVVLYEDVGKSTAPLTQKWVTDRVQDVVHPRLFEYKMAHR